MSLLAFRKRLLAKLGASPRVVAELLPYNETPFAVSALPRPLRLPLSDEPFIKAWKKYLRLAKTRGAFRALAEKLPQLAFPIKKGSSQADEYQSATLEGVSFRTLKTATGLKLENPKALKLTLHAGPAGTLPLLLPKGRKDFVSLLRALAYDNEPAQVPGSMGAMMVSGFVNLDRLKKIESAWRLENPLDLGGSGWAAEIERIQRDEPDSYKDRFMILSDGPYSNVSGRDLGLSEKVWRDKSVVIRREHELFHYFCRRVFGTMRNNFLDEFLADMAGILAGAGRYRADWFLKFMGLERFPEYREGGRLQNYRGDKPLSDSAFKILQRLATDAAQNAERFCEKRAQAIQESSGGIGLLLTFSGLTLEQTASDSAGSFLEESYKIVRRQVMGQ